MACLDTSFLIDALDEDEAARETMNDLDDRDERHAIVPVTAVELWIGANLGSVREFRHTEELVESLLWLDVDRDCARRAGRLQAELMESGTPLGFNDCVIAATAIEHGHELVTGDADFEDSSPATPTSRMFLTCACGRTASPRPSPLSPTTPASAARTDTQAPPPR